MSEQKSWSIDRKKTVKSGSRKINQGPKKTVQRKNIQEKVPDVVSQMLVNEALTLVGNSDWNDPLNVSKTIAEMMSIDLSNVNSQTPRICEIDRTVLVPANKENNIPYWICQSIIRVDEKFGNRFIEYKGAKYNKIDIIFENEHFKQQMNNVAQAAHCTWNARWGNAQNEENRLYQKTRTGSKQNESWLDKCIDHLLTDEDVNGINIKNLVMFEFKRDLSLINKNKDKVDNTVPDCSHEEDSEDSISETDNNEYCSNE